MRHQDQRRQAEHGRADVVGEPDERGNEREPVGQHVAHECAAGDRVGAQATSLVLRLPASLQEEITGEVRDDKDAEDLAPTHAGDPIVTVQRNVG